MTSATLLLPPGERFGGQKLSAPAAQALGRGNVLDASAAGRAAQVQRVVQFPAEGVAFAALTRQADVGDASGSTWLRADPSHLMADINGVRLLAHGPALQLEPGEADALVDALQPLFREHGWRLDAPESARWYVRLPTQTQLPVFPAPADVLGDDVFDHIPQGPDGRIWRALASDVQVLLHNHPLNASRARRGQAAVNALWFWGGGMLPGVPLHTAYGRICSDDDTLQGLAAAVDAAAPLPARFALADGQDVVFDLVMARDLRMLEQDWLQPALDAIRTGQLDRLLLDNASGAGIVLRKAHGLRFWRRPMPQLP